MLMMKKYKNYLKVFTKVTAAAQITFYKELEIWGKAQRESARRPKSDWGKLEGWVKFSRHQGHVARTQMHWHTPNAHCRLRVGQRERL